MIKKLLLVEDDPITQMLERIILSNAGFCQETMSLDNGIAAVDWLETYFKSRQSKFEFARINFFGFEYANDGWMGILEIV